MATLVEMKTKKGPSHWKVVVRISGFPTRSRTFRRKTDALRWGAKVEIELLEGQTIAPAAVERRTVRDLVDRYLEGPVADLERLARSRAVGWERAKKKAAERRCHLEWWRQALGGVRVGSLTPALIADCRDQLAAEKSPGTVNRYLSTFNVVLKTASNEWGWIAESPVRKVARKKEPPGCGRPLTKQELRDLLEVCRSSPEWRLYPAVLLAISTGMRMAELERLTWDRLDLEDGSIFLRFTKNDEPRRIPLQEAALREMRKVAREHRREGVELVFARRDGKKAKALRHRWEAARAAAGLLAEGRKFRWHDLRVTAATWLAEHGATVFDLMQICGWKTPQTAARYVKLSGTRAAEIVARMNEGVFREIGL